VNARRRLPAALALLCIAALPLVAERLRAHRDRCEMDGVALSPEFLVRVTEEGGETHAFCGVTCAESWISRSGVVPSAVLVTDGALGVEVDARTAWFVRTLSNVSDGAPDAIRVFARKEDAHRQARAHGGRVLTGRERPFGNLAPGGGNGNAEH
jgi:hypothetical protein